MRAWVLLAALASSGAGDPEQSLPNTTAVAGELGARGEPRLRDVAGILHRDDAPFSGYVVERAGDRVLSRTPYLEGRRHGRATAYYPGGERRFEKEFRAGNREGTHRGWWPSGALQFVYRYEADLFEGEQIGYYKTGARAELRHYRAGHEEGRQTTWDAEGGVAANYTFKDGRRYGIVGRFDCVSVHENE